METERVIMKPAESFADWAKRTGETIPPDHIVAEVICGALAPSATRASRGKWRGKASVLNDYYQALKRYEAEVASGAIPMIEERVPLNPDSPTDQAYARAMAKRAARKAGR